MEMRPSRVLDKLRAGKMASCVKINSEDSRVIEIAAMCGFDCVWTDMEHVPNSIAVIEKQVLAAKAYGTDILVRTRRGGYNDLIYPLELDASGIMVPHLMNLEDAKRIVKMSKFHPVGLRPVDGGNADGAFCMLDFNDYLVQANERRFVVVQIEDPEPLDELEEICALPGLDMIFFGPGDFSQGIGTPGDFANPEIDRVRRLVAETAVKHGKFAGTVGGVGTMKDLHDMGYRFVSLGADVVALSQYFKNITDEFNKLFG